MLSPREAAMRLGISLSLVYQLCKDGQLEHYRLGSRGKRGRIRIALSEVERFLAESVRRLQPTLSSQFKHLDIQ